MILELRNQGVRSARKTDGSGVMGQSGFGWTIGIWFVWEGKGTPENAYHFSI